MLSKKFSISLDKNTNTRSRTSQIPVASNHNVRLVNYDLPSGSSEDIYEVFPENEEENDEVLSRWAGNNCPALPVYPTLDGRPPIPPRHPNTPSGAQVDDLNSFENIRRRNRLPQAQILEASTNISYDSENLYFSVTDNANILQSRNISTTSGNQVQPSYESESEITGNSDPRNRITRRNAIIRRSRLI